MGEAQTYKEARGHRQSGLNLFLAQFEGDLPASITIKLEHFICKLCDVSFLQNDKFNAKGAQSHYAGKSHMKKFKLELKDWHERYPVNNKMPTIKGKIATFKCSRYVEKIIEILTPTQGHTKV